MPKKQTWICWMVFAPEGEPYDKATRAQARRWASVLNQLGGNKRRYTVRKGEMRGGWMKTLAVCRIIGACCVFVSALGWMFTGHPTNGLLAMILFELMIANLVKQIG